MSDDFLQSEQNAAAAPNEKYNTQFIVANLEKDKQRTKFIVIGVIVAVVGAVSMLAVLGSGDDPTTRAANHSASAATAAAAPTADAAKPAEH
jgi:hypothetical protein